MCRFGQETRRRCLIGSLFPVPAYGDAAFAPIAGAIRYVSAPGAIPPDYAAIPYTKRTAPFWPRVDDPFVGDNQAGEDRS